MKFPFFLLVLLTIAFTGCREASKAPEMAMTQEVPQKTLLEKLADKHGFEHWDKVNRLQFTFNVDRGENHFERTWIWEPQTNTVTSITATDTLTFQRDQVDSLILPTDAAFINDKYWLLAPYQWVWDQDSFTHEYQETAQAPISGENAAKLTIVYGNEGGYTPGDAYDFYFGKDSVVREWVFRKGNQPEPSLAATWEQYQDAGGLQISTHHQNADGSFKLYFTGVQVN
ncbi:hypothetical protein [Robiginitalea sp.]|uniref:hypothetical protein n=1 Tax=Robiginitalea sp. TaxID=1902411 RepID=UPI003C7500DF